MKPLLLSAIVLSLCLVVSCGGSPEPVAVAEPTVIPTFAPPPPTETLTPIGTPVTISTPVPPPEPTDTPVSPTDTPVPTETPTPVPPTDTPTPVPPTPTPVPPTATPVPPPTKEPTQLPAVEVLKPSWANIDESLAYGGDPNVIEEAKYWQVGIRNQGLNLPKKNWANPELPDSDRERGPFNMRIGKLKRNSIIDHGNGEVEFQVYFDDSGLSVKKRTFLGHPLLLLCKVPNLEPDPIFIYWLDGCDSENFVLSVAQRKHLLNYYASREMLIGVREAEELTDFIIFLGLQ